MSSLTLLTLWHMCLAENIFILNDTTLYYLGFTRLFKFWKVQNEKDVNFVSLKGVFLKPLGFFARIAVWVFQMNQKTVIILIVKFTNFELGTWQIREHFWQISQFLKLLSALRWGKEQDYCDGGDDHHYDDLYLQWQCVGMSRKMSTSGSACVSVCYDYSFLPSWYNKEDLQILQALTVTVQWVIDIMADKTRK